MLLGVVQRMPGGNQSGLDKYLFGQAAAIVPSDVRLITLIAALLCLMALLFYKEFKLLAFDPGFGAGLGFPMTALDLLLNLGIVVAVVIGLEAVGVVLMAALLTTPAVTARYWTNRLSVMLPLAGLFGALSGVAGTLASQVGPPHAHRPPHRAGGEPVLLRLPPGRPAAGCWPVWCAFCGPGRGPGAAASWRRSTTWPRRRRARRRWRRPRRRRCLAAPGCRWEPCGATWPGFPGRGWWTGCRRPPAWRVRDAWKLTAAGVRRQAYPLVREERLHLVCRMHEADLDGVQWDAGGGWSLRRRPSGSWRPCSFSTVCSRGFTRVMGHDGLAGNRRRRGAGGRIGRPGGVVPGSARA